MTEEIKKRTKQINSGIVPVGYKKTSLGIVPSDWEIIKAKEIFANVSDKKHGGQLEVLSATQERGIIPRRYVDIDIKYDKANTVNYKKVNKGNFVISLRSFQGGIEYSKYNGIISPAYTVLSAKKEICNGYYKVFFKSPEYIQRLNTAVYGIRDGKNISYDDFSLIDIPFPPIEEQQKIASVLSAQDELIELKQKLIDQKKLRKKWLMQNLLTGKIRLEGFSEEWEQKQLKDICIFINGRAYKQNELLDMGKYKVLRVGNIFTNTEWYYSNLELSKDKYIENGDLIYAWSASFSPYIWNGDKVIYHYHIWKIDSNKNINKFFLYYFLQYDIEKIKSETQGGTMAHITKETMKKREIILPTIDEQTAIASILSQQDNEIELLEKELELQKLRKKALMQLLLTGKVRCNYEQKKKKK